MCGLVPAMRLKRSRKAVGEPNPTWARDAFDGVRGRFQQVLGPADPGAVQPLQRRGAGLLAEAPVEGARAHARPARRCRPG